MDNFCIASELLFLRRTSSTLPIPRACCKRARFSAPAAALSRFTLSVCASAGTSFAFAVGDTGPDGDFGGAAGGGSGGGVGGTVDSSDTSGLDRSGTVGVVLGGNGVPAGLATSVDGLPLGRFNKDPSCEGGGTPIGSCDFRFSPRVQVCEVLLSF